MTFLIIWFVSGVIGLLLLAKLIEEPDMAIELHDLTYGIVLSLVILSLLLGGLILLSALLLLFGTWFDKTKPTRKLFMDRIITGIMNVLNKKIFKEK